jgi:transcriptional regulator with XRE-family HTH domain
MSPLEPQARNKAAQETLRVLGLHVRHWREKRGLTQEEFAQLAGFSRSYVTEIETGKRNVSFLNLLKIVDTLQIDDPGMLSLMQEIRQRDSQSDHTGGST